MFQGRFKSILVENDAYLLQLSYYIHRNALRAGMVKRLAEYPWSRYTAYAYGKDKPEWLNTEVILGQLVNASQLWGHILFYDLKLTLVNKPW